ncbi:MAG: hypothetical protein JSS02_23920 [Planctomycetes bacterium]|nr:hypothetical protein [Planctomycetota bacterium]
MKNVCVLLSLSVLAALSTLAGCSGDSLGAAEGGSHDAPAHRPRGFPEAVQAIRDRLAEFQETGGAANRQFRVRQSQELKDIMQWLPELAAETDLRKADWDNINAASKRMVVIWDETSPRVVNGELRRDDASLAVIEREVDGLQGVVKRISSDPKLPSME